MVEAGSKRTATKTAKRLASLEEMKNARGVESSRLDALEMDEEDDVYENMDEEAYQELVTKRREGGDFVVDDDGLGYYDDGEEVLGIGQESYDAKKRLKEAAKEGDNRSAKKARKLAEMSNGQKNTITRHFHTGGKRAGATSEASHQPLLDIDALLGGGSSAPSSAHSQQRVRQSLPQRRQAPSRPSAASRRPLSSSQSYQEDDNDMGGQQYDDNNTDSYDQDNSAYDDNQGNENAQDSQTTDSAPQKSRSVTFTADVKQQDSSSTSQPTEEAIDSSAPKISLSKSTRKFRMTDTALEQAAETSASSSNATSSSEAYIKPIIGDNSADPMAGLSEIKHSSSGADSGFKIDPKTWLLHTAEPVAEGDAKSEEYVDMYWLDASELNGVVYLFGKIPINDPSSTSTNTKFVSCCVVVHGNERNLFVLPRAVPDKFKEDGSPVRHSMGDVYKELSALLVPDIVPRAQGQSFRVKGVTRNYAFEVGTVPRQNAEYMKVVYSSRHGYPSPKQCEGGNSYERIFGTSSGPLELFLLKRKLMGPCWIRIKNPKVNPDTISWCRIELGVESPKHIKKVAQSEALPPPTLVSMCLSMKTAVNPVTHLHEIVALSGLIHTKVDSEADTPADPKLMRRFTFVRQLGLSCGNGYPAMFPHDLALETKKCSTEFHVQTMPNERAMLSLFFARIQQEDPDIIASHNLLGFEFDVILHRAVANKLPNWSILGRLKRTKPPKGNNDSSTASGRILCDTYKAAKEFLRETTYSLGHLAQSQLGYARQEIDPMDVPRYFSNSKDILKLAQHTFSDAVLVQRLMLKLQVVPLTKQLTTLSGNLWSRTIKGARAERIEYLLLHEFHSLKFILPEKKAFENKTVVKSKADIEDEGEEADHHNNNRVGGNSYKKAKASYAGGLVLEPKKGLYDTNILLLDFNSLYPSLIQEYNLCFTTINWTKYMESSSAASGSAGSSSGGADADGDGPDEPIGLDKKSDLAPLPDTTADPGILPKVIKNLVDRRREVKNMLKREKNPVKRLELDIRQKALKLTANSMYGCLGFSFSRFYARPIAALVTAMGREALQRTVDLAKEQMGLDVIYGDTDSVMINTNSTDLAECKEIGNLVKKEVNKLYKCLELDMDGIFKSMLLLKKKKYAAVVITENLDGTVSYEKELKGLDLVRRDWCPLSKDTGKYVVDQILSGNPREDIVLAIHDHLRNLADKIRTNAIPMEQYIVTKGLNKNPKDYPDCKGQAHLQVALQMLKASKPVNVGDHIPYVICLQGPDGAMPAQRAHHPDDVVRANGALTLDLEWYLSTQILPPISRLCEPIEGTSQAILSECLGLDASKYIRKESPTEEAMDWGFTPKCMMEDADRFRDCVPLKYVCLTCKTESDVPSVMQYLDDASNDTATGTTAVVHNSGLSCISCGSMYYGRTGPGDCYCYLSNTVTLLVRDCIKRYYDCWLVCDDDSCGRRTMQQSVKGFACVGDCHGRMHQEYDAATLHTQLKYLESLFDVPRLQSKLHAKRASGHGKRCTEVDIKREVDHMIPEKQQELMDLLRQHMANSVSVNGYNWVQPSLWERLFGKLQPQSALKIKEEKNREQESRDRQTKFLKLA